MSEQYSPQFIDEMREKLEEKRAELVNRSHRARTEMHSRDRVPGDSIDESTDEQGTSTELALKDRDRNYLTQINAALDRITDGEYGYCVTCGRKIGEQRLRARPAAPQCIECKTEAEENERRHHAKKPGMFSSLNQEG